MVGEFYHIFQPIFASVSAYYYWGFIKSVVLLFRQGNRTIKPYRIEPAHDNQDFEKP